MPPKVKRTKKVTLRGHWLGKRLRELREEQGFTLEYVAEFMQRANGTISRFETGVYPIRRPDVLALLDLYGVSEERERDSLIRLSESVWQTGWWDGYANDVRDWLVDFVWLEEQASEQWLFQSTVVPGILQTEAYARAVMAAASPDASKEQMDRWIALRVGRQALLDREQPPAVRVVLDESVLRRRVGSSRIMSAQLKALAAAATRDRVDIRILSYEAGVHATLSSGSFSVYRMEDPYPEVGYVETPKGALYVESPESESMMQMYDRLWDSSLPAEASVEFITTLSEELQ
ncbi:helix-turn-helix domain-containing protein [Nocardiopsis sp. NPDC101807]|uniref:helix-turn-helix domain-containing protein n=1 Tax=Nocardiopsis sp. NPDC101807 TaxID=3364339 RepID=UPI003819F921